MDLGGGDFEEHAILLANFFSYIDEVKKKDKFKTYLVYCNSMPEGNSIYVMRQFADSTKT